MLTQTSYLASVIDNVGNVLATRPQFKRFSANMPVNELGAYEFELLENDDLTLENGDLVTLRRRYESDSWQTVFAGIHRLELETRSRASGNQPVMNLASTPIIRSYESHGYQPNELMALAHVNWEPGSVYSAKSGDIITVLWEYVNENVGPAALVSNGRYADNNNADLTLSAPPALIGIPYDRDNTERNLMDVVDELTALAFENGVPLIAEVVYAGTGYGFIFNIRRPTDRTNVGVSPITGLNVAGNKPVILSLSLGNVSQITRTRNYTDSPTQVVATGQDVGGIRQFGVYSTGEVNSRRRELTFRNRDLATQSQLVGAATAMQAQLASREQYAIELNVANVALWRDFDPWDIVTLEWDAGTSANAWVNDVSLDVRYRRGQPSESIRLEVTLL